MRAYEAEIAPLSDAVAREMQGVSWHPDRLCPPLSSLRLVRLTHVDFAGEAQRGELVVAAVIAEAVADIFARLFAARFPIAGMQRIEAYGGSDAASMADNNSSAFNFRRVEGSAVLSHHALGLAIDINPVQNPWVRGARIEPASGAAYLDRADVRPGMIVEGGRELEAFSAHGFYWGGAWDDAQDYHHFSKLPRDHAP